MFSFSHFAADMIEKEMRKLFSIPDEQETRLWNRYMSNTFEPLNKPDSTIQDAGLYQGQVGITRHGSWPNIFDKIDKVELCWDHLRLTVL